jgi:hypothetical protein
MRNSLLGKAVMIAIQHGRNGSDFIWKQTQIQCGVALLHHTSQCPWGINTPFRTVNGSAITTDLLLVAHNTAIFGNQLLTQRKVGTPKNGWNLGMNRHNHAQQAKGRKKQCTHRPSGYRNVPKTPNGTPGMAFEETHDGHTTAIASMKTAPKGRSQ